MCVCVCVWCSMCVCDVHPCTINFACAVTESGHGGVGRWLWCYSAFCGVFNILKPCLRWLLSRTAWVSTIHGGAGLIQLGFMGWSWKKMAARCVFWIVLAPLDIFKSTRGLIKSTIARATAEYSKIFQDDSHVTSCNYADYAYITFIALMNQHQWNIGTAFRILP